MPGCSLVSTAKTSPLTIPQSSHVLSLYRHLIIVYKLDHYTLQLTEATITCKIGPVNTLPQKGKSSCPPLPEDPYAVNDWWGGRDTFFQCGHWQGAMLLETILSHVPLKTLIKLTRFRKQ